MTRGFFPSKGEVRVTSIDDLDPHLDIHLPQFHDSLYEELDIAMLYLDNR